METVPVRLLRTIPPSNQPAQPLAALVGEAQVSLAQGFAQALAMWGLVSLEGDHIRASSQTAHYALLSLAEWLESGQPIITDWNTRGVITRRLKMAHPSCTCWSGTASTRSHLPTPHPPRACRTSAHQTHRP